MRSFTATCIGIAIAIGIVQAADTPRFRTDADGPVTGEQKKTNPKDRKPGDKPDWFQLVEGQFPPQGSAHAVSGELIRADHLERRLTIRVDRNDSQDRGVWDLPLDAGMLPYGSAWHQGAMASLRDIPVGTHLRGLFYRHDPADKTPFPDTSYRRKTPEWEFRKCFLVEDDFSHHARKNQSWRIESVDLATRKLTAILVENGKPAGEAKASAFDLQSHTRVFKGGGFGELKDIQPGQSVLFNLTWVTLYGPGRITDIWLDEPSRALATARQAERHRNDIRERGLPGWVSSVDDKQQLVTVTFFGNVDPKLFDEVALKDPNAPAPKDGTPPPSEPRGALAVARDTLMTYDPVNDRKGAAVLEVRKIAPEPGSGGVQVKLRMDMMLEGFRPKRVVRFYPPTWKVLALPKEEEFHGRE